MMITKHVGPERWPWATLVLGCILGSVLGAPLAGGQVLYEEDFQSGGGSWYGTAGVWEVGYPASGPSFDSASALCAGTGMSGTHPSNTDSRFESPSFIVPAIDKVAGEELWVKFMSWFSYSACDYGVVSVGEFDTVSSSWSWTNVGTSVVNNSDWSLKGVDITPFASSTDLKLMKVGFAHYADGSSYGCSGTSLGWYIDEAVITWGFPGMWGDLALALPGSLGKPVLTGTGTLQAGTPTTVELTNALPGSVVGVVVGLEQGYQPLKGGLLLPLDEIIAWPLLTDGQGTLNMTNNWPSGIPGGTQIYFQAWILDGAAQAGYSASNGLVAITQ